MPTKTPTPTPRTGSLVVSVADARGQRLPIANALVAVYDVAAAAASPGFKGSNWQPGALEPVASGRTDETGKVLFTGLAAGEYTAYYGHYPVMKPQNTTVEEGCTESLCFHPDIDARLEMVFKGPNCEPLPCTQPRRGDQLFGSVEFTNNRDPKTLQHVHVVYPQGARRLSTGETAFSMSLRHAGSTRIDVALEFDQRAGTGSAAELRVSEEFETDEAPTQPVSGNIQVSMTRSETEPTADLKLWGAIKLSTDAMGFDAYADFLEMLFCGKDPGGHSRAAEKERFDQLLKRRFLPFSDTDAYRVLKAATEAFVMVNCGIVPTEDEVEGRASIRSAFQSYLDRRDLPRPGPEGFREREDGVAMLPYLAIIRRKLPDVPIGGAASRNGDGSDIDACDALIAQKLRNPCLLELIWSYWHEEAMQVQTMNAVSRRFQNVRGALDPDPLANLEVNPLRPLNNLLWGYIQDEQHRLTVARRNAEYDHHYGIRLEGRAVQGFRGADTRSKFIEAFHHLLRLCTEFYKQDDDTTVKADAFGVLNALKEVHLIQSQGAHSQFGDLPVTSRIEMLMQQWLLARPEFREFLPTRVMVAYPEAWMDRVDAMKKLQGWTDTSVIHFHNLAVFGEQVLLAIRYGAWSTVFEPTQAFNFARFWRPQIQGYIHAYRAATGVELGAAAVTQQVDATLPSLLLQRRLQAQRRTA